MLDDRVIQSIWDDLLEFVEDGKVIPIIGAELLEVEHEGSRVPLYTVVARKVAERLLPGEAVPADTTLNDVVCRYTATGRPREDVYPKIRSIMRETQFKTPEVLRKLARITPFNLFVTLTFDSLLAAAINEVRFGGRPGTIELAYAPGDFQDLETPRRGLRQPVVYHLFGKVSAAPDYVITDECILEFLHGIQSAPRRANLLFDELRANHLLFLGCNFADWFARFFIRIAKSDQLSKPRPATEVLVDSAVPGDGPLVVFLEHFSRRTRMLPGTAADFVTELEARYLRRAASAAPAAAGLTASGTGGGAGAAQDPMRRGSVFISYASEDYEAARTLHESLDAAGIESWFDKERLGSGDAFAQRIRSSINNCACFVPLISANTSGRLEGFFRREWYWARDRAEGIAEGTRFIMPVSIDGTTEGAEGVPELFRELHWTDLPGGVATAAFADTLKALVRDYQRRLRGS